MSHYENDVPFEVPAGWVWCRLKDITSFLSRGKSPQYSDERKYPVFAQKCNLKDGGISLVQARFLDPKTINKWGSEYKLCTGDVLINSTGTGTVGRSRIFNSNCLGTYPFVVPDSHVSVVRTFKEVNSYYIYMLISSRVIQEYLEDNLAGSTNQKELYIGVLEDLFVPLPPMDEQNRIVIKSNKLFSIIDCIEKEEENLSVAVQNAKSKILDLALSGKLTSDTSHYGKNEESFSETTLGNVCKLCDGEKITGKDYTNLDVKYLRGTKSGDMLHSGRFVKAGSLMILVDGENSGEVFTTPVDGYQGSTFKILDIDATYCKEFILLLIQSNRKSLRENKVGSAIPHLNKKMFKEIVVPPFSYSEQCEIAQTVKDYFCVLDSIVG